MKPGRRVLVLVNPVGGKGKAKAVVKETVMPILEAAGCHVELIGEFQLVRYKELELRGNVRQKRHITNMPRRLRGV